MKSHKYQLNSAEQSKKVSLLDCMCAVCVQYVCGCVCMCVDVHHVHVCI